MPISRDRKGNWGPKDYYPIPPLLELKQIKQDLGSYIDKTSHSIDAFQCALNWKDIMVTPRETLTGPGQSPKIRKARKYDTGLHKSHCR